MLLILLGTACTALAGKIVYVDDDANGLNNGTSWLNAYKYLQDALANANSASKPIEIRVAQGIYKPDRNLAHPNGNVNSSASFRLINGVTLKGGYAGPRMSLSGADPNAWDVDSYETILSGDIGRPSDKSDNCYHVFYHPEGLNLDDTAILDGFTIAGGNANMVRSPIDACGGGMYNYDSSPTVTNCTFTDNSAYDGGGMYNYDSSPTVTNCTFTNNSAYGGGGGGMCNYDSSPTVTNCTFTDNSAYGGGGGGGMCNWFSRLTLTNCTFSGNSATNWGGGMCNYDSSPTVTNCTFTDNSAYGGGGMYNYNYSSPTVKGCTFSGNSANYGGGMCNYYNSGPTVEGCTFSGNLAEYGGGGMYNYRSSPTVTNCTIANNSAVNGPAVACDSYQPFIPNTVTINGSVVWNGHDWMWNNDLSTITVTYSDVQGGWEGQGNINTDPCFADTGRWQDPCNTPDNLWDDLWADGEYHLKSQAGRWDANEGRWTKDDVTSLCIDAGDLASPIGLEPFPNGGRINMGAYGGTAEASKSYFGEPVCEIIVAGDINGDCKVNLIDFAFMALHWLEER